MHGVKRKRTDKKIWIAVVILAVFVLGLAAGYYVSEYFIKKTSETGRSISQNTSAEVEEARRQTTSESSATQEQVQAPLQQSQQVSSEVYSAYARFEGNVDVNTLKLLLINTDFNFKEFEVDENLAEGLSLNQGEIIRINFEIVQGRSRPKVVSIEKPDIVTLKGKFIGLADNNFAEFVFDSKHVVLEISSVSEKVSYLDENTDVEVTFKTNPASPQSNPAVEDIRILK